jgi:hypothetical protein
MKTLAALAASFLFSLASYAHELTDALGSDVALVKTSKVVSVKYCPDNTCEVFSLKDVGAENPIQDFAFAYLFSVSDYIYLEHFQAAGKSPSVQSVLSRYRSECTQSQEKLAARCVVSLLVNRYPITASFVRYDEGKKKSSPISLGAYRRGT